ncbi:Uncharacterised protein [Burkholderia pseudomallei]|nr:Uncharacterised protein [Burkholderia pseudomallei]
MQRRRAVDVLGDRLAIHRVPDVVDRRDDVEARGIVRDARHEAAVDLQVLDGQLLQIAERRHPGAEIVEREPAAERLQLVHEAQRAGQVRDRRRLGDLETDERGRDARARELFEHIVEKALVADRDPRQIDRVFAEAPAARARERVEHRAHDPAVDVGDEPVALGRADEKAGRRDALALAERAHAQQQLAAPRARQARRTLRRRIDDRLHVQAEIVVFERLPHARAPRYVADVVRELVIVRIGQLHAVAPARLRDVARDAGEPHRILDARRAARPAEQCDADARRHRERLAVPDEHEAVDARAQALGRAHGRRFVAGVEQHAEFVAAEPRDDVGRRRARHETRGERGEHRVARRVAARIVDDPEAIQVDEQQRDRLAHVGGERETNVTLELCAARQAGERIVRCLPREAAHELVLGREALEHEHAAAAARAPRMPRRRRDRRRGRAHGDRAAVRAVERRVATAAVLEIAERRIGRGGRARRIRRVEPGGRGERAGRSGRGRARQPQRRHERTAAAIVGEHADQSLRRRIQAFDAPRPAGEDHAVADGDERRAGARFAHLERSLRLAEAKREPPDPEHGQQCERDHAEQAQSEHDGRRFAKRRIDHVQVRLRLWDRRGARFGRPRHRVRRALGAAPRRRMRGGRARARGFDPPCVRRVRRVRGARRAMCAPLAHADRAEHAFDRVEIRPRNARRRRMRRRRRAPRQRRADAHGDERAAAQARADARRDRGRRAASRGAEPLDGQQRRAEQRNRQCNRDGRTHEPGASRVRIARRTTGDGSHRYITESDKPRTFRARIRLICPKFGYQIYCHLRRFDLMRSSPTSRCGCVGWMTQFISHWRAPDAARTFPALALQACRSALPRMKTKCRITASRIPENNRTQSKFKT